MTHECAARVCNMRKVGDTRLRTYRCYCGKSWRTIECPDTQEGLEAAYKRSSTLKHGRKRRSEATRQPNHALEASERNKGYYDD